MAGRVDVDVKVVPGHQLARDLALQCDRITEQC
jgi:hypothetical protein